jgi:Ser-tRNA(Ala) deacylase AlaX
MAPPNDDSLANNNGVNATPAVVASEALAKDVADNKDTSATTTADVPPTDMLYYTYDGNFRLECDAEIVSCQFISEDKDDGDKPPAVQVALNRTVLHAQGGGQPTDTGVIELKDESTATAAATKIVVDKILLDRATGVANHMGTLHGSTTAHALPSSLVGQGVTVHVDAENRRILSECHTAGHVVDMAMAQCDMVMPATKAYHFLDGPYVEYKGNIAAEDRPRALERLQAAFRELVEQDIATEIYNVSRDEAQDMCDRVAENYFDLPAQFGADETVRIVKVAGWPCPCGGTHVKSTGVLKARQWGITGFKCKKGVVRVKYGQDVVAEK